MSVASGVGGVVKASTVKGGGLLFFFFKNIKYFLFAVAIIVIVSRVLSEVQESQNPAPIFLLAGKQIAYADAKLYGLKDLDGLLIDHYSSEVSFFRLKNVWFSVKAFSDLFITAYIYFFTLYAIYLLVRLRNTSAMGSNILFAVLIFYVLQIMFNQSFLIESSISGVEVSSDDFYSSFIPARGVLELLKFLPKVATPIYNFVGFDESIGLNETINVSGV